MAAVAISDLPAGVVLSIKQNSDGTWPNRPTSRTDLVVLGRRTVAGSSDPAIVTSPAVNGLYDGDPTVGVL